MAQIRVHGTELEVALTLLERVAGLLRDQRVPLSAVRAVDVVPDGLAALRGVRAPGLGLPGLRGIGTWRRREGRALAVTRRGRPAVRVALEGHRWSELLVDVPDAEATRREVEQALGRRA